MKVIKAGDMYKASFISGPKHNYLGVVLTREEPGELRVVERTLNDGKSTSSIDEKKLVAAVQKGVQEGNRDHASRLCIAVIEFVPTDTPDYEIYAAMAKSIVTAAVSSSQGP